MRVSLLLPLASVLLLLPHTTFGDPATGCCDDHGPSAEFLGRVREYVELHRAAAANTEPEEMCGDPEQLYERAAAFAAEIRALRPSARTGDVFTPPVASFFRAMLASGAPARYDVPTLLDEMDEEGRPGVFTLEPHASFPWDAGNMTPPGLLRLLPELPEELEYRFVGRDLVLLDVRANLIVDVLEAALPGEAAAPQHEQGGNPESRPADSAHERRQPCDVHPEMPACWM